MSCSQQVGVATYLNLIEEMTGLRVTQAGWHTLKQLTAAEGGSIRRTAVNSDVASGVLHRLAETLNSENDADAVRTANTRLFNPHTGNLTCTVTAGTVSAIDYLINHGVEETVTSLHNKPLDTPIASVDLGHLRTLVSRDDTTPEQLNQIEAATTNIIILSALASHNSASPELLNRLSQHYYHDVRRAVGLNLNTEAKTLTQLAAGPEADVQENVAAHLNTPTSVLDSMKTSPFINVRLGIARNPNSSTETLRDLSEDRFDSVSKAARAALDKLAA